MRDLHGVFACALVSTIAFACTDGASAPAGSGTGGDDVGGGAGVGGVDDSPSGLPCDVAAVLAARCTSCHSDPPRSSAPQALVTREQLLAPAEVDPTVTNADRSVLRMRAGTMPAGGGAQADADVIDAWLAAGAPAGECGGAGGGPADDPFATPSVCVSGQYWSHEEGRDMAPGGACNTCHRREAEEEEEDELPIFAVAGTVYPNGHAPDDCYGIPGSTSPYDTIEVWVVDATSTTYRLDVRGSGNFMLEHASSFTPPYTAKVVDLATDPPRERVMVGEQTEGDCNLCHTENGFGDDSDAPGRIMIP